MGVRTLSEAETVLRYGDPRPLLGPDGLPGPQWEAQILGWCFLPAPLPLAWDRSVAVTRIRCHREIRSALADAFEALHARPAVWATIGDFGGCYHFRTRRGSKSRLSRHCWGIAVDLDVADNPDHSKGHVHPATIEIFEACGFYWGGHFAGEDRDPMHFEIGART